jgi:hypothetical protein
LAGITIFVMVIFFTAPSSLLAQADPVPLRAGVYDFLERMTVKGLINEDAFVKPLVRSQIARHLNELSENRGRLTAVEQQELDWYVEEYAPGRDRQERWYLFSYGDSVFSARLVPKAGVDARSKNDEFQWTRWWGFQASGSIGNSLGFLIEFSDHWTRGARCDHMERFTNVQEPPIIRDDGTVYEFDVTEGALLYHSPLVTIGGAMQTMTAGSGVRSQLALSQKPTAFPSLIFNIHPVEWMSFYYFHGWLLSRVRDTLASYSTAIPGRSRNVDRDKCMAFHALEVRPVRTLSITAGESVIYSDRPFYWGYLIPFAFYRSEDHGAEANGGVNTGSNSQMFFDAQYQLMPGLRTHGTFFVDELSVSDLLNGKNDRNQTGYTIGLSAYGIPAANLMLRLEYTKIQPWVYSNYIPAQTYTHSESVLGSYIGQNADQWYLDASYTIRRGLVCRAWFERIRQGGFNTVDQQYTEPGEDFLYGPRRTETSIGLEVSYEIVHDWFVHGWYTHSDISDDDPQRTPSYMLGSSQAFGIGMSLGKPWSTFF